MKPSVLIIVQAQPPLTGRVGRILQEWGYRLDVRDPIAGDPLPEVLDDYAGVVVFGGPMSVNDADRMPGLARQIEWLPALVEREVPLLGICLGAQLLARSLGARVAPHPDGLAEIGYFPINATGPGRDWLAGLEHAYQWHVEGFELPPGARLLASGETFANQAYRVGRRAFGIQFHPEVDAPVIEDWLVRGAERLQLPGAQTPDQHRQGNRRHDAAVERWLHGFLRRWLQD